MTTKENDDNVVKLDIGIVCASCKSKIATGELYVNINVPDGTTVKVHARCMEK